MTEVNHLSPAHRRVIGVLIEKSLTTPQYYPLTLNALVTGCNQKSNRDPAVEWVEEEVDQPVPGQETLFGSNDDFTIAGQEWKGMPEFVQNDVTAWKSILVNFENRSDLVAFAELIGQSLTTRTRSIWYPEAEIVSRLDKRYRDASADVKEIA